MGFKSQQHKEAFAKELADAGFSAEEIATEISGIETSAPAPAPVPPPTIKPSSQMGGGQADAAVAPPLAPATPAAVQSQAAELTAAREPAGNTLSDQLFTADTAKLLAPVATYGVYKGAQAIKDRMFSSEKPQYPTGPEPTMGAEPSTPENKLPPAAQQKAFTPKEAAVANNITEKYPFTLDEAKTGLGISDVRITNPTDAELVAKQYSRQIQAAVPPPTIPVAESPAPAITPAPIDEIKSSTIAETPKAPVPIAEAVPAGAVPPEEKKKGGRPSAKSMEGTTFRPDLGPGDNWLYNTAGPDRRKAILAEFNEGKPAKDYESAQKLYKKYQEKYPKDMFGPVIPVEQAKARGIKPPENYGQLGKVAKVGGVAGLALTAAEMANAAQKSSKGNDAPLRESIFNLLGMIPGLGTAFSAGTYSGGLNENQDVELARRRQMPPTITTR
jgi:hypothetical protein